jgi:poly-gamma-glutamate synthesis protein (capsule biosynthesis protein)
MCEPYQELSDLFQLEVGGRVAYNLSYQILRKINTPRMLTHKRSIMTLCFTLILASCSTAGIDIISRSEENSGAQSESFVITASADATITATPFQPDPKPESIYFGSSVPKGWIQDVGNLTTTENVEEADLILDLSVRPGFYPVSQFDRIYAVGVPFDSVIDNISIAELQNLWVSGTQSSAGYKQIFITDASHSVFIQLWGLPFETSVKVIDQQDLVSELWTVSDALTILPFEEIEPRLKILEVDGINPLDRPMDEENYGLTVTYILSGAQDVETLLQTEIEQLMLSIPATNRDESKMAVVMMTGTTALARVTLKKIDLNGYDYPVEMVKDWFLSADLRHVSNEVSFMDGCTYLDANTMQFCSKPDQIKVLENIGVNVVESTGNHMNDFPGDAFTQTLNMYQERGWLSFGGGFDEESAKQPATIEVNGNKIAFIGCNPQGPKSIWATESIAGAAKCDFPWFYEEITKLKSDGYIVISTFQSEEIYLPMFDEYYRTIFKDAAKAGADIIQGSQAHVPMGFEFIHNSLIHYGLGNFLFDQMEPVNVREFYDRHIIYNGKYISTELLTATLTDWSRPVPMNESDRQEFLNELFTASRMR